MLTFLCLLLGSGEVATAQGPPDGCVGYLYQAAFCMDYRLRQPAEAYLPQPGDLFLATDHGRAAKIAHWAAGTGAPQHSGVVMRMPDASLGLLEGGPHNTIRCRITPLLEALQGYAVEDRVWIRRRCLPLTPEQSDRLTAFALSADGKRFAVVRLFGQMTPFRSRGPLRTRWRGGVRGERASYFCSELVVETLAAAGLLDPATARPSATYPRDLFFARSRNRFLDEHFDLSDWAPPARWTLVPGAEPPDIRRRPRLDGDGAGP
jgi:hypothetical protein